MVFIAHPPATPSIQLRSIPELCHCCRVVLLRRSSRLSSAIDHKNHHLPPRTIPPHKSTAFRVVFLLVVDRLVQLHGVCHQWYIPEVSQWIRPVIWECIYARSPTPAKRSHNPPPGRGRAKNVSSLGR